MFQLDTLEPSIAPLIKSTAQYLSFEWSHIRIPSMYPAFVDTFFSRTVKI